MIDKKKIEHIAKLARLKITDEEAQEYSVQLGTALNYFEKIAQIDTEGVEPLVTPTAIESYWREDIIEKKYTPEEMTQNAPAKAGTLFKVPPVV